jgi:hypothetical protein
VISDCHSSTEVGSVGTKKSPVNSSGGVCPTCVAVTPSRSSSAAWATWKSMNWHVVLTRWPDVVVEARVVPVPHCS